MSNLQIHQFIMRDDNFGVLIHDPQSGQCASIDAPQEAGILAVLEEKNWHLSHILLTHHHFDHVEGVAGLKERYGCHVMGPAAEKSKIENMDALLNDGDVFEFGGEQVRVISTPGHTLGMINFYFESTKVVFTGDTLFALGCGRVFEGDGAMMNKSMAKLAALPEDTAVYCGHEYTLSNGRFALEIDPTNEALKQRMEQVVELRAEDKPTLPTSIGAELATNPFLRTNDPAIRQLLKMENASDAEVFTEIRNRKDRF